MSRQNCDEKLNKIKRINILSDIYVSPYVMDVSLLNPTQLDRFSFDTSTVIAGGSFGAIYKGVVDEARIPNSDPLKSTSNPDPKYVVKLITSTVTPETIQNISNELNIQNILYNMDLSIKIPYVYNLIFTDTKQQNTTNVVTGKLTNRRIAYISEYVHGITVDKIIYNDITGTRLAISYDTVKRCIFNPLFKMVKSTDMGISSIVFKHNDLHCDNMLYQYIDSQTVEPILIDFGTSTIRSIYGMNLNNNIFPYITHKKIEDYYGLIGEGYFFGPYVPTQQEFIVEVTRWLSDGVFSDFHFFLFSFTNKVNFSIQNTLNTTRADPTGTQWDRLKSDLTNRYGFITMLTTNNGMIYYKGSILISLKTQYPLLYKIMVSVLVSGFMSSLNTILWGRWGHSIAQWRFISMFIEFYMKDVDPISYNNCICEFL